MNTRLNEYPDRREWDLSGLWLSQLCFDNRVVLLIDLFETSVTVIIGVPFSLHMGSQAEQMDPVHLISARNLLQLIRLPVESLTAFRSNLLLIKFEDGTEIRVPMDEKYESWETFGTGELADINMLGSSHEGSPWGG